MVVVGGDVFFPPLACVCVVMCIYFVYLDGRSFLFLYIWTKNCWFRVE